MLDRLPFRGARRGLECELRPLRIPEAGDEELQVALAQLFVPLLL
jgi:hypothetical protein